ncbi:hypothetical protein KJN74_04910, partial [Candidatus Bathyarchaeota archaeon]|nr:hypothetical protein [Candidatus Bathyarchaeota archaeon]
MGSRSTKLKKFLLVDLAILVVIIPSIFYIDSQILEPTNFEVSNLIIDSDWVQIGEELQISIDVTNTGDISGNDTVTLTIDEIPISTKTLELMGGVTKTVDFTLTELVVGNHTIGIGSYTQTIMVTEGVPTKQAKLELEDLGISRTEAGIGDSVTVSVTATNIGDLTGEFSLELFVNNQFIKTEDVHLDGGESTTAYFEVGQNEEGEYFVKVENLSPVSFKVTSDAEPIKPAEFQVSDLTINPTSVLVDEIVEISVKVTNVGEETGNYDAKLILDDVLIQIKTVSLPGGATEIVEFQISQNNVGEHNVKIDNIIGSFNIETPVVASANIKLERIFVNPYEVWEGETVNVRAIVNNTINEEEILSARLLVANEIVLTKQFVVPAGASDAIIEFQITAGAGPSDNNSTKGYSIKLINLGNQSNILNGYFVVAPDGYHTISINRSGGGSTPMIFTFDGVVMESPYFDLLPANVEYSLSTDEIVDVGTGIVQFSHWNDGVESASRTFTLDKKISLLANYIVISGYASCPSLYIWNGTGYTYITEVSNAGWLGYIDYITDDGEIVFGGGNPWDHVKLDKTQLQPKNDTGYEYYDMVLFQQWDEIYYLDSAYLVVVDHPNGTEVFSTMVNYVNRGFFGKVYT